MIATNGKLNGKANGHIEHSSELFERLFQMDFETRSRIDRMTTRDMEPRGSYYAGESDRMSPVPSGVNPLGTDADSHYQTERNYFLMVERGRAAVRNHPLVESGINRLIANLRLGDFTLDVDSGDEAVDAAQKADWLAYTGETQAGRNLCDYTGERSFSSIACQSFFNQVVDGDIVHLPLYDGSIQTFESHHLRNPYGHRSTGESSDGIIHGVQVRGGKTDGYWLTPNVIGAGRVATRSTKTPFFPAFDTDRNRLVFHLGFMHRFGQHRGVSRLSPPREAMNGFEDANHANIAGMLKRALLAYWLEEEKADSKHPFAGSGGGKGGIPQAGPRTTEKPLVTDENQIQPKSHLPTGR
jgi:hypothetical protein